jgi:hypothetical protein
MVRGAMRIYRCDMLRQKKESAMATKNERSKKPLQKRAEQAAGTEDRAPAGRGGVAMGRTVGLPFGGARPRKRKSNKPDDQSDKSNECR